MATNAGTKTTRNATVNLRLQPSARDLIDRAAAATGKTRTDFMVEAARREAEAVLLDRCFFALGEKDFAAFRADLDRRPKANARLRRVLSTPAPWD